MYQMFPYVLLITNLAIMQNFENFKEFGLCANGIYTETEE